MFRCRYHYTEEDNLKGSITTIRENSRVSRIVCIVLISLSLVFCLGVTIIDIILSKKLDIWMTLSNVLLITLLIFTCLGKYPMQRLIANKVYKLSCMDKDFIDISFDLEKCRVSFFKGEEETNKEVIDLNKITFVAEDEESMLIVFNKHSFILVKWQYFEGDRYLFKKLILKNYEYPIKKLK